MTKTIDITSKEDLNSLLLAIITGDKVQIGEVKPIPFVLRFKGETFKVQDGYISADFADFLVTFKKDYREFLVRTIGKTKARDTQILFKVEDGSIQLDLLNELPQEFWELVGKMDGTQLTITAIVAILGYFSHKSWKDYLDAKKEMLQTRLANDTNIQAIQIATDAIELLKSNKKLEVAKNRPIKQAISMLTEKDTLEFLSEEEQMPSYTQKDEESFSFNEEEDDVTTTHKGIFAIKGFTKETYGWNIKVESSLKTCKPRTFWAVSKLDPRKNIELFKNADDNTSRELEIVLVKNRNLLKEAYIVSLT